MYLGYSSFSQTQSMLFGQKLPFWMDAPSPEEADALALSQDWAFIGQTSKTFFPKKEPPL